MSGPDRGREGGSPERAEPARTGTMVALLARRGRFLTAEPLFPARADGPSGPGRGASASLTLGSTRTLSPRAGARAGDLVLLQAGARGRGGKSSGARIVRVLGRPEIARDVIEALMLDRGLRRSFEQEVEREARAAGKRALRADVQRRDLRELATFTIDPLSARDFDDAISAESIGDGVTRVWIHIADVGAHVPEGSAIDREARRRATSVYVPGAVEPMLPHALSSDACSLAPGKDRAAVTVELELKDALVVRAAFYRSLIRSDARLDYERVDRIFAGRESAAEPWRAPLGAARGAAAALQRKRELSGALVVDSGEPEFSFDERGNVTGIANRVQSESHRLIEHLMIAANEAVAALLAQQGVPCLYRVHERPQPERIERLIDQLASLDVPTPPMAENMSPSQAAAFVGAVSAKVHDHVRRTGRGGIALNSLVLRSLKQAYYSPTNLGHAGLRSSAYCHFTSPIRRYPDLVCHRALLSAVGAGERAPRAGELAELGSWTSEREREASVIERDADDVARCFALEAELHELGLGYLFSGEITGLIGAGAFIAFGFADQRAEGGLQGALAFEGMLPVRHLRAPAAERAGTAAARRGRAQGMRSAGGQRRAAGAQGMRSAGGQGRAAGAQEGGREWWELNEQGTIMRGERSGATLRLGDAIEVRVARVDSVRGRVDLTPAS